MMDVPTSGSKDTTDPSPVAAGRPAYEQLFAELLRGVGNPPDALPGLREFVDLAEAWRIHRALRDCRGNRSAAARALGIGRRTLYSKLDKLGIEAAFTGAKRAHSPLAAHRTVP
jgi:DNA-binding NtrC family response regulator